jgi:hypothetical protein
MFAAHLAAARARATARPGAPQTDAPAGAEPLDPVSQLASALAAHLAAARAPAAAARTSAPQTEAPAGAEPPDPVSQLASVLAAHPIADLSPALAAQLAAARVRVPETATPWTPQRIRKVLREPGVDHADPELVAACIDHFGSVTAARAAAERQQRRRQWTKELVIAELQARSRRGLKGLGRLLRDPAIRLFGSAEAALHAAAHTGPRSMPRTRSKPS